MLVAAAINGGMFARSEPFQGPVITIGVDDLDDALARVEKAGGAVLRGRTAVGDMGFSGYFRDPDGNIIGLWQSA